MGRIVVVGLGPGDPGLVTAASLEAIDRIPVRRLRTRVHPSAHLVGDAPSFDHLYEASDTFDEVYRAIVDALVADASRHDEVLYAVPGSPRVLERSVDLLAEAAATGRVELEVLAAMSFVDLAWVRLGVDPFEDGVRLIDGHRFPVAAAGERGPLLVAHCHNRRVLSDVKLAVEEPPSTPVVVLQRLGLPDEAVFEVEWADLDRDVEADHLTSIYVPELVSPVAAELMAFVELVRTLRVECPWDAEQTHASLARHLVEETYEVVDALDGVGEGGPDVDPAAYADLEEELGDLLFQIVFHSVIAAESGVFDLADVARGVHDKLRHRHPHVFARDRIGGDIVDADRVVTDWERIKKAEKGRGSVFDGIPRHLPALALALKAMRKTVSLGLDLDELAPAAAEASVDGAGPVVDESRIGAMLQAVVALAHRHDVDPESALRRAADALIERVRAIERGGSGGSG